MKKHKNHGRVIGTGERIFDVGMTILGILISIVVLYPIYYALIASLSKPLYVGKWYRYVFHQAFYLESYKQACAKPGIWLAYANTIFYTAFGVLVNMAFSTSMAYALSKKKLMFRKFFTLFTVFTL